MWLEASLFASREFEDITLILATGGGEERIV